MSLRYTLVSDDRPRLGLIVLQADETIEDDFRRLFDPSSVQLHITRVPSGADLTPASIAAMEAALPEAARLFPQGAVFDAIGYACTSGASQIGPDRVSDIVQSLCTTSLVTDPLTASFASLQRLGAHRIGLLSPYTPDIAKGLAGAFKNAGFQVAAAQSFGEKTEANVARIAPASIKSAALDIGQDPSLDALFLSCTNLRTLDVIPELQAALKRPVLSSNQALARHMAAAAGLPLPWPAATD